MSEAATRWRVLVVEDESMLAMSLEMTLTSHGYSVVGPVGRLGQALVAAREEQFDLALLDVCLAGEEVFPLADLLSERAIPFAFLTGYDPETMPPRHEGTPVLVKPVRSAVLIGALEALKGSRLAKSRL
jgi:DNA-binding response OmpR family regulator